MIAAIAATLALSTPSRELLVQRWLQSNRSHSQLALQSAPKASIRGRSLSVVQLHVLVHRELAKRGRYQFATPSAVEAAEPWWARAWDWIATQWQKLWKAVFTRAHVGRQEAASVGDVLLLGVGALLIFVVVRLLRNVQSARSAALAVATEQFEDRPTPRALYKRACACASTGNYGAAALLLFAATVALLDRQGAIGSVSSATVGEMRRQVKADDSAITAASFDAIAAPFVQAAYAERSIDELQWQRARAAFERAARIEPVEA